MIYTVTLWADNLNPYKPNIVVAKILIDCENIRLIDKHHIATDDSTLSFPNNTVTIAE